MTYPPPFDDPIVQNLIASGIYALIAIIFFNIIRFARQFSRFQIWSPIVRWSALYSMCLMPLMTSLVFPIPIVASVGFSLAAVFLCGLAIIKPYYKAGIVNFFAKSSDGIKPDDSLQLVHERLDFLGIGADKLTRSDKFEAALERISTGGTPVRFLLSPPENRLLEIAANRAGIKSNTYQERVIESIKRLRKLKYEKGYNIEVKFYPVQGGRDYQQFRLMFIDRRICLLSYTIWDSTDGSDNPQYVLKSFSRNKSRQLINAFQDYFDKLWNDSSTTDVDWSQYE